MPGYIASGQPPRLRRDHYLTPGLIACFAPTRAGSVVDLTGRRGSLGDSGLPGVVDFGVYGLAARDWVVGGPSCADLAFTSGAFTIAVLLWRKDLWTSGQFPSIFGNQAYTNESNNQGWIFQLRGDGSSPGNWSFQCDRNTATNSGAAGLETGANSSTGNHLIVGTSNGSNLRTIFIDGISRATSAVNINPLAVAVQQVYSVSSTNVKMPVYYAMCWNRALTENEVNYLWMTGTDLLRARRNRVGWTVVLEGVLPTPAFSSIVLADTATAIGNKLVAAADSLVLAGESANPSVHDVGATSHLGLWSIADGRNNQPRVAAASGFALADTADAHDATIALAATQTLHLRDRATATRLDAFTQPAAVGLVLSDVARAVRDLHVAASSGLGLTGPGEDLRTVVGVSSDSLALTDSGVSNQFYVVDAADSLQLATMANCLLVGLGNTDELRFHDRADGRLSLAGGGGPPGGIDRGLRDVLLAGLSEEFPVSFCETPNGLILIANGIDPLIRWDGLSATAEEAGVVAPSTGVALGGFGVGTITGQYEAYQRFLDRAGTPSNLSPVSNTITCGSDGPVEGVTGDPDTGIAVIRSTAHGLADGSPVVIQDVEGVPIVNGTWMITVVDDDHFVLDGLALTAGTYTAGGTWSFGVTTIAYSVVESPAQAKVARRQILRNLDADASVYYCDIDTDDLTSDTFFSTKTDEELASGDPVPILYRDETPHANRFGMPPSHKAYLAAHLGRIFLAGEVTYDRGSVSTAFDSTTVRGIGTAWRQTFAGRLLYVVGAARSYEILAVDEASQTLTLTEPWGDPVGPIAGYAIRPAPGERRLVYYSEPSLPESWPAWNAVALPEDGDEITGLMIRGSFLYVLENRHIYRFTFQEDPSLDGFTFLSTRRGALNHRCQVQAEDSCYLLDEVGIHRFDGQTSEPISTPIQQVFQRGVGLGPLKLQVNWDADRRLWHAAHDPVRETIRWFVAMSGWREPRHALCLDYRRQRWWIEEYPHPVTASTIGTIGHRRSLAGTVGRRVLCLSEGTLDGLDTGRAGRGTVGHAGPLSVVDPLVTFSPDLVGTPVQVVAGRGAGQARVIAGVDGSTLTIDRPWMVRPDATSTYQLGGVPWRWRSGWYELADDEGENPRDVVLVYAPLLRATTVDARLYYDHMPEPRLWAIDRDQDGVAVKAGEADVRFDLDTDGGHNTHRLTGHSDPYAFGDAYVSVQLAGVQATEAVRVFGVILKGAGTGE